MYGVTMNYFCCPHVAELAGWIGFMIILAMLHRYIVMGITLSVRTSFSGASERTQNLITQFLVDKPMLEEELYQHLTRRVATHHLRLAGLERQPESRQVVWK